MLIFFYARSTKIKVIYCMKDINVLIIVVYKNKGENYEKTFLKLLALSMLVDLFTKIILLQLLH